VPLLRTRCPADFRHFCNDLACDAENRFSRKLPAEYEQGRMELELVSQRLIPTGERSGLLTRIAATESVSLCVRMKS